MKPEIEIVRCKLGRRISAERTFLMLDVVIRVNGKEINVGDDVAMDTQVAQDWVETLEPFIEK